MKYMTSSEIRDTFLKFFESKGSAIMPSQSLVPVNDPTLLWINSGVATMKKNILMVRLFLKILG